MAANGVVLKHPHVDPRSILGGDQSARAFATADHREEQGVFAWNHILMLRLHFSL